LIEIDEINVFEEGFDNDLNNNLPFAKKKCKLCPPSQFSNGMGYKPELGRSVDNKRNFA
jgi:hypothetical protein